MAERLVLDLFCEDSGHEVFVTNLVRVMARSLAVPEPLVKPISARGGHGRAISELKAWQRGLIKGSLMRGDALIVLIDGNSTGWRAMDKEIRTAIDASLYPHVLIGCPDPHVEVWCAADPVAFQSLFSVAVPPAPARGGRLVYKQWLRTALEQAGAMVLGDPLDISLDLLPAMDLNRACRNDASLNHLVGDLRALLQRTR
ncbi:MAG: hypothetical protein EBX49_11885 [Synechococcaceae bacterium WB8_1B_136]|nr:hypothetical protein [Synechococcaceae bacterium WB8_1B_136]